MTDTDNYVRDLGTLITEKAALAKSAKESAKGTDSYEYQLGYLMAFHEIVDLMQQQAQAFGLDYQAIGLDSVLPDRDLL